MMPADDDPRADLGKLLVEYRPRLVRFLARQGSGLRRFEDAEDLAQGVHMHALEVADRFQYQGEKAFLGWLFAVARRYVANRNAYWKALKRDGGALLRITYGAASSGGVVDPAAVLTGPQTFAQRREHLALATRVASALPERDRKIAEMITREASIEEIADALGLSYPAAQRARLRTLERFRKLFTAASGPATRS